MPIRKACASCSVIGPCSDRLHWLGVICGERTARHRPCATLRRSRASVEEVRREHPRMQWTNTGGAPASSRDKRPGRGGVGWFCWRNLLFSRPFPATELPTHDSGSNLTESTAEPLGINVPEVLVVPRRAILRDHERDHPSRTVPRVRPPSVSRGSETRDRSRKKSRPSVGLPCWPSGSRQDDSRGAR